jgi:cytochrome P450
VYLDAAGKPTIVFNSMKSAFEFLEHRASNSSGRPRSIVASDIINKGLGLPLMDHGKLRVPPEQNHKMSRIINVHTFSYSWRRMRRAAQEALTKAAVQRYHSTLTKEATILASAVMANPENRDQHFKRATASTMLSILYDFPTLTSAEDKAVQEIDRNLHHFLRAAVGTSLVEFFPWMIYIPERSRYFPGMNFTSNGWTGS